MRIFGLDKFSLLDYPGKVSSIIFLSGCNMNCSYCYNSDLIKMGESNYSEEEVLEFLNSRVGKIDGVVITGGEPTLNNDLIDFIKKIKKMGLLVKLDTNGSNPSILKELIDNKLLDYIAMDIKTSLNNYNNVTNVNTDINNIKESINMIKNSGLDHEFRTTVYNIHDENDLIEIAKLVSPSKYFLQDFMKTDKVLNKFIFSKSEEELEKYVITCNNYTLTNLRKK
jgi:pyruvate formate lyase activating enzyme